MKLAFTTLGCPGWDLDRICTNARQDGFDGVDFRGYLETLDITALPLFTSQAESTRKRMQNTGLTVSGISSSIRLCKLESLAANLEEARRTIETAKGLGAGFVRVFGGGEAEKQSRAELVKIGAETMRQILLLPGATDLCWALETHDLWIKSTDTRLLLDRVPSPAFAALWDIGHTARVGGEAPGETWAAVGSRVRYCHVKDAVKDPRHPQAMEDGWRYVSPGTGQLPLAATIGFLKAHGYHGWMVFEHEKRWHPELAEPEEAFPAFARWARPLV